MNQKKVTFLIEGTTAILCHNPAMMVAGPKGIKGKKIPTPEAEAAQGVYAIDGIAHIRKLSFHRALLKACMGKKVGKRSAKSVVAGAIEPDEPEVEFIPLLDDKGEPISAKNYTVDTRRAVVQGQGIMRSRPKFWPWGCKVSFRVNADVIPEAKDLMPLMEEAGMLVGVGDYRPEKTGWFGKFTVKML